MDEHFDVIIIGTGAGRRQSSLRLRVSAVKDSFLKQRLCELFRVEGLQVVRLLAEAALSIGIQTSDARASSNPGRTSERTFPSFVAQESNW
jgi:hypothetical protein